MDKKESAKERILHIASDLFYREGIRAVGIDRIIAESGVAKASFYRNFATKDDLVVAFLEQRHQRTLGRIAEARSKFPDDPAAQLYELFRMFEVRMTEPNFRGCPFMNTTVEFPDKDHPGHHKSRECRLETWRQVEQIAREAGATEPAELATQLEILYSGAVMTVCLYGPEHSGDFLKTVKLLMKQYIPACSLQEETV
ncbi:TetR/AcrR family transcriptional regulator [Paenibacillus thalictri]|uniref:TetR/AcrR family transcriptional regulator n=1 Tax=Paenibacillus thalictri TaxID=2527873 RepID=A0A4Q9DR37_9BACL|nr:TetR/AcrR family transcriptional regulator [Paenibacillus thalictri]TBL77882.1 TetR/AcrR family transcriptional regulator [Paenibacillus thalictri]